MSALEQSFAFEQVLRLALASFRFASWRAACDGAAQNALQIGHKLRVAERAADSLCVANG
jgi:hypothetical protein